MMKVNASLDLSSSGKFLAAIQQPYLHFQNTVLYPSERLAVQSGLDIVVTLNRYSCE